MRETLYVQKKLGISLMFLHLTIYMRKKKDGDKVGLEQYLILRGVYRRICLWARRLVFALWYELTLQDYSAGLSLVCLHISCLQDSKLKTHIQGVPKYNLQVFLFRCITNSPRFLRFYSFIQKF